MMTINKNHSQYSAAITGGGFMFNETDAVLPLLQSPDRESLIRDEMVNNRLLMINSERSRKNALTEIKRRYDVMPAQFWCDYQSMPDDDRRIALFFVILKTYKILFDFHINVTMRKWKSVSKSVLLEDLMMEFNEIASADAFVDSWSDLTKKKVAGAYLSILRKIEMLDVNNDLHPVNCSNFTYYITQGEQWFLEACLLQPYEIDKIKKQL